MANFKYIIMHKVNNKLYKVNNTCYMSNNIILDI